MGAAGCDSQADDGGDVGVGRAATATRFMQSGSIAWRFADAPARELRGDVASARSPTRPGMPGAMPVSEAPWQLTQAGTPFLMSPLERQLLAAGRGQVGIDRRGLLRREGRVLLGEVFRHLLQVGIGQVCDEVVHRRVAPRTVAEGHQLVEQVARRFAGDAREVAVRGALPALAVARDTPARASIESRVLKAGTAWSCAEAQTDVHTIPAAAHFLQFILRSARVTTTGEILRSGHGSHNGPLVRGGPPSPDGLTDQRRAAGRSLRQPHREAGRARHRGQRRHPVQPHRASTSAPSAAPAAMPTNMPTTSTALRRLRAARLEAVDDRLVRDERCLHAEVEADRAARRAARARARRQQRQRPPSPRTTSAARPAPSRVTPLGAAAVREAAGQRRGEGPGRARRGRRHADERAAEVERRAVQHHRERRPERAEADGQQALRAASARRSGAWRRHSAASEPSSAP